MSDAEARSDRIRGKIAAAQDRLQRDSAALPAVPARATLPDAYPPESYRSLAAEYPWLAVAAGAGFGLLAGALLPKKAGGKLGRHVLTAAALAGEFGLALSQKTAPTTAPPKPKGAAAMDTARGALDQIAARTAPLRTQAVRSACSARSAGLVLAREAIKLAVRARTK